MPTVDALNQDSSLVRFKPYGHLEAPELRALMSLVQSTRKLPKHGLIHREGDARPSVHLLLEGWTASSITSRAGKRQFLKFHMAGDLIGLPALPFDATPDTVTALTPVVVGRVDLAALGTIFREHPRLSSILFMISQEERASLMESLFVIGAQDAAARVASLILQLYNRMTRAVRELTNELSIPLTQADLAELAGITPVHMNRTLRQMQRDGLLSWSRKSVELHDRDRLQQLSGLPARTLAAAHPWLPQ